MNLELEVLQQYQIGYCDGTGTSPFASKSDQHSVSVSNAQTMKAKQENWSNFKSSRRANPWQYECEKHKCPT